MALPETIPARRFPAAAMAAFLFLLALGLWSCNNTEPDDIYSVTLKLDSARVGKFDSVKVEIYNGAVPKAGDTTKPVQTQVIKVTPTTKEVTLTLSNKVKKDFSVVVTGFDDDAVSYRNLHTVDGFKAPDSTKPSILLITQIKAEELTLSVGETRAPVFTITPNDAKDKKVVLTSLDPDKVEVIKEDSLKGLATGSAKIKATSSDGAVAVEFAVTVVAVRVTDLQADSLLLAVGDSVVPTVKVVPDNATDKDYTLESLDTALFAVDGKAVKAKTAGRGRLVIASKDGGAIDTLVVRVRVPLKGIKAKDLTLEVGDKAIPVLEFDPPDATDKGYGLTTSDTGKVAMSGAKDSLEAKAIGQAKVTVKANDGGFTAEFTVDVLKKVIRVTKVTASPIRGLVGDTLVPKLAFTPTDATEKGYTLVSLDTSKVLVADDKVVAKALGTARVVATTVDGGFKDTIVVAVELSSFIVDIKPITTSKCGGCHIPPSRLDWTDSAIFVRHGAVAINRLKLPESDSLHMPLPGATGGPITPRELKILLAWLARVVVPLQDAAIGDTTVNLGDTLVPAIAYTPANASNKNYTLTVPDTSVTVVRGGTLIPGAAGKVNVTVTMEESGKKLVFALTVKPPEYEKNVRPIVSFKCAPCHFGPTATYNWQDSSALISSGTEAIRRLGLAKGEKGRMPFASDTSGPPNGELSPQQMRVLLGWLHSKVVPLIGITVPNDSVALGASKEPVIIYNPANASNKTYALESADTNFVQVDEGKLVGVALGSSVIHITALDGGFSKFFTVKVIPVAVDSIAAHDSAGAIGDTVVPHADFFPANATNKAFTIALLKASTKVQLASGNRIIGIGLGKDTLEATSTANPLKKSRFTFTVGPVLPTKVVAADTNGVVAGSMVKPRLIWTPATTTDKRFTLKVTSGDTATVAAVRDSLMLPRTAAGSVKVEVKSVAVPAIVDTFTFTVGTVPATAIAVTNTPISLAIGSTATPTINFTPTNTTNKGYTLTIPAGGVGKMVLAAGGLSITGTHLSSATNVVVTTSDGSLKTANWNITVIRPPMGTANKTLIQNRCGSCHYTANPSKIPAWWDKTNLKVDSALIVTGLNPDNIIQRVAVDKDMPPTTPALTTTEINTLVNWLNTK